jgi:hypothetical protein
MLGLIEIKYGKDNAGNVLSLAISPDSVGSVYAGTTGFFVYLNSINTTVNQPNSLNFSTKIAFYGPTGAASAMNSEWVDAANSIQIIPQIISLDFQSQGYLFEQTIVQA